MQEGNEGVVSLEEQDHEIVELALTFLYSGSYRDGGCAKNEPSADWIGSKFSMSVL